MEPREETAEQALIYNDKKKRAIHKKLYIRTVVLLDNKSTMDLFCNPDLVEYIQKVKEPLRIQYNGRDVSVNQKYNVPGYNNKVWFSRIYITKIVELKNLT